MSEKAPNVEPVIGKGEPAKERSADLAPTIEDSEDLERVLSEKKPEPREWLSEEAKMQIEPKLRGKKAA
jgi:hypothetical protein